MGLYINSRGKLVDKLDVGRVVVPTFEIYQNPTIEISDVKKRRFNIIDRKIQKAKNEIMEQEDSAIFELLNKALGKDVE